MKKIYLATYESTNFSFKAIALSEHEAIDNLKCGLFEHARKLSLGYDWFYDCDIQCEELKIGCAYRYGLDEPLFNPNFELTNPEE
jgi:hypothetical protein